MRFLFAVTCAILLGSCMSQDGADQPFIALDHDFAGWDGWESAYFGELDLPAPHVAGPCWGYINHRAPARATSYPVGTIIMKVTKPSDDPTTWQLFGMAKRGGDFNADGAVGWEWFELNLVSGNTTIGWRGASPPPGSGYTSLIPDGGFVDGGCNTCHGLLPDRDYIADDAFAL